MTADQPAHPFDPDPDKLPGHIAIIMDGNGRWAASRKKPRVFGHRAGVKTVDRIVTFCRKNGIKALTLYSFSSENWRRPKDEVSALMKILQEYLIKELNRMLRENIRFNTIGDIDALPEFAKKAIADSKERTRDNDGMILTLALSYGGRDEIRRAVTSIAKQVKAGILEPAEINEATIADHLDTASLPDPDLLIRTSGEYRTSNFLPWQTAYTELFFTKTLWPDFNENDMAEAITSFQSRERRFGLTGDQLKG
jgi:undecaprenyl diphosphate synthase